jgi:LytS/YehU family sensor histidine kinase
MGRAMTAREAALAREGMLVNGAVWLLALSWLGGSADLVAYFRQRRMLRETELLEQVERYKDERNEVEMRLAVLAGQVEPHFLFNTLSGVRAAMLSDPARGVVMIDHLVDYLRSTIPQLRADRGRAVVSLGSQLDAAQAYLGVIQARLPRLAFRIDCPDALRAVAIPPLMLISLVENAVKHGIELKVGPALVCISAERKQGDVLELSVADDGGGFGAATSGSGIGLANIRERLKHLYGGEASLSLRAGDNGGVVASIVLPIRAVPEKEA